MADKDKLVNLEDLKVVGDAVTDLKSAVEYSAGIDFATEVDAYHSANASSTANPANYPYVASQLPTNFVPIRIKLKSSNSGSLSIGYYPITDITSSSAYSADKFVLIEEVTLSSGVNDIALTNKVHIPSGYTIAFGKSTDTATIIYGSSGTDRKFYFVSNGNFTSSGPTTSVNISVEGITNEYDFDNGLYQIEAIKNAYIKTNIDPINYAPTPYAGYVCAAVDCSAGDVFTITGRGGDGGRTYAFVNSSNHVISKANDSENLENKLLIAPSGTVKLILNANTANGYSWIRGDARILSEEYKVKTIQPALISEMPEYFTKPTVAYSKNMKTGTACIAKGGIIKNSNGYCVTYGENLDGTTDDFPRVSGTGTLAIKYRAFVRNGSTEESATTGTIAQKGSTYTTWDGNTATFTGGCGLPSVNHGIQFFVSAYSGSYTYNGISNYGMRPCCVPISVSNAGAVTVGTITEMSLTINGTKGAFDVTRLSANNVNYQLYYTTMAPFYDAAANNWHWLIPVKFGFAYFTSSNAIDWTYVTTYHTDYQPIAEVACAKYATGGLLFFAVRTWADDYIGGNSATIVGVASLTGYIRSQYRLPSVSVRPTLSRVGNAILLTCNETSRYECSFIVLNPYDNAFAFRRWFRLFGECTWYTSIEQDSAKIAPITSLSIVGGNGKLEDNNGVTFAVLSVEHGTLEDTAITELTVE